MCLLNCNTKKKGYNNQNQETKIIASALDRTERRNRSKFYRTFNTITFDNRVEFIGYKGIEKSCLRKEKGTKYIMRIHVVYEKEEQMRIIIEDKKMDTKRNRYRNHKVKLHKNG